jgi:hypothetical protein
MIGSLARFPMMARQEDSPAVERGKSAIDITALAAGMV